MEKQLKILVVDDDKSICRWLNAVLTEEGYLCCAARSVEEAEPLLRENPIDLALLDIYIGQANVFSFSRNSRPLACPISIWRFWISILDRPMVSNFSKN